MLIFDDGGQPYVLIDGSQSDFVQTLMLGPAGLSAGTFFDVPEELFGLHSPIGATSPDVAQNEVFASTGGFLNLASQLGETRYDPNAPSFDDGGGGIAVNADVSSGDVYLLVNGLGGFGIGKYDYATNALTAEQQFDVFTEHRFEESLFDIGADQLGIIPNRDAGLIVIDKAVIQ